MLIILSTPALELKVVSSILPSQLSFCLTFLKIALSHSPSLSPLITFLFQDLYLRALRPLSFVSFSILFVEESVPLKNCIVSMMCGRYVDSMENDTFYGHLMVRLIGRLSGNFDSSCFLHRNLRQIT